MVAKKGTNVAAVPGGEDKWQIEDDLRTLTRAREIQKDAGRMKAVRKLAKEKVAALEAMATDGKK